MKTKESRLEKRKLIESNDKKLIRLRKRMNELWKIKHGLPLVQLEKPIRRGFKKTFKLREDIARRKDAKDFQRILGVINQTIYCKTDDFKIKKWHNNQMEDIPHVLKHIPENQWDKLDWPEHFKKWFVFQERHHTTKYGGNYVIKGYWFKYDYMFDAVVLPNFVTHRKPVEPHIERELKEIDQYFEAHDGWHRLQHLHGRRDSWRDRHTYNDTIGEEFLRDQMKEFEENYLDSPNE